MSTGEDRALTRPRADLPRCLAPKLSSTRLRASVGGVLRGLRPLRPVGIAATSAFDSCPIPRPLSDGRRREGTAGAGPAVLQSSAARPPPARALQSVNEGSSHIGGPGRGLRRLLRQPLILLHVGPFDPPSARQAFTRGASAGATAAISSSLRSTSFSAFASMRTCRPRVVGVGAGRPSSPLPHAEPGRGERRTAAALGAAWILMAKLPSGRTSDRTAIYGRRTLGRLAASSGFKLARRVGPRFGYFAVLRPADELRTADARGCPSW
jgi:hypothetical protein